MRGLALVERATRLHPWGPQPRSMGRLADPPPVLVQGTFLRYKLRCKFNFLVINEGVLQCKTPRRKTLPSTLKIKPTL
eukprot:2863580-Pyramimonas_sp.AAC.1